MTSTYIDELINEMNKNLKMRAVVLIMMSGASFAYAYINALSLGITIVNIALSLIGIVALSFGLYLLYKSK